MITMKGCISCNVVSYDYVSFKCPVCGEEIVRCKDCRAKEVLYVCKCGFEGP